MLGASPLPAKPELRSRYTVALSAVPLVSGVKGGAPLGSDAQADSRAVAVRAVRFFTGVMRILSCALQCSAVAVGDGFSSATRFASSTQICRLRLSRTR